MFCRAHSADRDLARLWEVTVDGDSLKLTDRAGGTLYRA